LKRAFQKHKELSCAARNTGDAGLRTVHIMFQAGARWARQKIAAVLQKASERLRSAVTVANVEGVGPTHYHAERCLRPAVLWRKRSFGNHSAGCCRFTERMLTGVHTLKLQKRPVFDDLKSALHNHRSGKPAPSLLTA